MPNKKLCKNPYKFVWACLVSSHALLSRTLPEHPLLIQNFGGYVINEVLVHWLAELSLERWLVEVPGSNPMDSPFSTAPFGGNFGGFC
jgi:hypothetical protein